MKCSRELHLLHKFDLIISLVENGVTFETNQFDNISYFFDEWKPGRMMEHRTIAAPNEY